MSSDEFANNSVACATASSLPWDFVFLNFGKKYFLKYVSFCDFVGVSTTYLRTPTTDIKYNWAINL